MNIEDLKNKLSESNNKILQNNAKNIGTWSKMKHDKASLEVFLNHNIAEIEFVSSDNSKITAIVCSNTSFINLFNSKSIKKIQGGTKTPLKKSDGIVTKNEKTVKTWNIVKNKYFDIPLKQWFIKNWLTLPTDYEEAVLINDFIKNILGIQKTIKKEK